MARSRCVAPGEKTGDSSALCVCSAPLFGTLRIRWSVHATCGIFSAPVCHMRHTGAENIPHVAWTDHRILRVPNSGAEHTQSAELSPVFSPGATQRDLAMAYYQALREGNSSVEPKAWKLLQEQRGSIGNDAAALDAFGLLNAEHGNNHDAEEAFHQVLK